MKVVDTGKGIPEEDLGRILEPFEQSNKDQINIVNQGVGLGLAITKRLIELSGGDLIVESVVGEGSTFTIQLPLQEATLVEEEILDAPELKRGDVIPDVPVLIVDDNELNILVARKMVENWGYDVVVAKDSVEAERVIGESSPFLVLLDIHMPGRDGFEAASEWRAMGGKWKDLAIIGLTADAETLTRNRALESGMNEVVVKPFNPPHLRSLIEASARNWGQSLS